MEAGSDPVPTLASSPPAPSKERASDDVDAERRDPDQDREGDCDRAQRHPERDDRGRCRPDDERLDDRQSLDTQQRSENRPERRWNNAKPEVLEGRVRVVLQPHAQREEQRPGDANQNVIAYASRSAGEVFVTIRRTSRSIPAREVALVADVARSSVLMTLGPRVAPARSGDRWPPLAPAEQRAVPVRSSVPRCRELRESPAGRAVRCPVSRPWQSG